MKHNTTINILRAFLAIIIFSSVSFAQTGRLKGNWNLTALKQNGNSVDISRAKASGGKKLGISFERGERFGLISTCNGMGADYTADARGNFKPGAIIATRMFCGDDAMKIENALAGAMEAVTRYEIRNNRLILRDRSGRNVLTFSRAAK
ncbi:MAG: META domain-containing protein [Acidobacteriota bacterium]|nr:META domain-containing protein [Acidobacteriota bacterium]